MTDFDLKNLNELLKSLHLFTKDIKHEKCVSNTQSLYRFGYFYINGHKYTISEWSFVNKRVTFETDQGYKVKYSINDYKVIGQDFIKDRKPKSIKELIRKVMIFLSKKLKELSDKL